MPRKRRKNRFGNHLITFLFIYIIFLLFYAFKNPILLYSSNPIIEVNQDYDPSSNIQQVFYHANSDVKISGDINTAKVGEYTITYQLNNYKKTCIVSVKDTQAPVLKVKSYKTDLVEDIKPESFVKSIKDDSKVTLSFKQKITKASNQTVTIIAKDTYNFTMKDAKLTLIEDHNKPVIKMEAIHVYTDSKPDYKSYLKITDNLDQNPKIKIDSSKVNTKKTGTYKISVTATDRSGNKGKAKIKVVVEQPK